MTNRSGWLAPDSDLPSAARVYDYMLGGSNNFAVDRVIAEQAIAAMPAVRDAAMINRRFLQRATRHMLDAGISQFLDLGSGIATVGSVHETAWPVDPQATVVYVDLDAVAVAHTTAILDGDERAAMVEADLRDVDRVLDDPQARRLLDLRRPVGVLMVAVLHNLSDADDPAGVVARYGARVAPGSRLAISHATLPPGLVAPSVQAQEQYNRTDQQLHLRPTEAVTTFFGPFEPVEPGVVYADQWHNDEPVGGQAAMMTVAGVGVLPTP